jgi:hypothetical protein
MESLRSCLFPIEGVVRGKTGVVPWLDWRLWEIGIAAVLVLLSTKVEMLWGEIYAKPCL